MADKILRRSSKNEQHEHHYRKVWRHQQMQIGKGQAILFPNEKGQWSLNPTHKTNDIEQWKPHKKRRLLWKIILSCFSSGHRRAIHTVMSNEMRNEGTIVTKAVVMCGKYNE